MDSKEDKKTVRIFATASFLNDMGSDMIYPIWPLFVTNILKANMTTLGFIDGLGNALVSISQAISGFLSDKLKRRKVFIWTGYLFGATSRIGYAISTVWQHLIPFRILDRAGKMRGAPRDAIIADVSTDRTRGKNFGFLRSMDHLGAVVGILLCIWLIRILDYRILFLLAAIPSVIGAMLVSLAIKEKRLERVKLYQGFSFRNLDNNFKLFLLLNAIFALGAFSYSFLLVFAKNFGFQTSFVPVLYLIYTLIASFSALPFGRLADKIGRRAVMAISFVFWAVICLSLILFQTRLVITLAFVLYGFHIGALEPVQKTFVSELAPKDYRASVLGGFQMVVGLCSLPASFIAGFLWDRINIYSPFYFSITLTLMSIMMLIFVKEKRKSKGLK